MRAIRLRRAAIGLVALLAVVGLALIGCQLVEGGSGEADRDDGPGRAGRAEHDRVGREGCRGVPWDEVRGPRPRYGPGELDSFPGERAACAAYWLPGANNAFVPQGLALDRARDRVWVGGYRYDPEIDLRVCMIHALDPRDGRRLASYGPLLGALPGNEPRYCRHGGGLALTEEGLWLSETRRLWLLDPDLIGTGRDPVLRLWWIDEPLRGSVLLDGPGRIALGEFRNEGGPGSIDWFTVEHLLRPGVVELVERDPQPWQAAVDRAEVGVSWLQGGTAAPDGTFLARSHTYCGRIRLPDGRQVRAMPGTEDIEFDDRGDLWTLSESGARNYQRMGGRPMVPMLVRFDADAFLSGPRPDCRL